MNTLSLDAAEALTGISRRTLWRRVAEGAFVSGDKDARIFTTSLEAELLSIAGLYRTFEAGVPAELLRQPATVSLIDDGLTIVPLALR